MGPRTRCINEDAPPVQPWQHALPEPSPNPPDFSQVRKDIRKLLTTPSKALTPDTTADGGSYYGALFATLAWRCASTFRETDYAGGCNGARIRFSPEKNWPVNKGMDEVLRVLEPVKKKYPTLSYGDLIVLAGTAALEDAVPIAVKGAVLKFEFCGGRSDAVDGAASEVLGARNYSSVLIAVKDNMKVTGLTPAEGVALAGLLRSPSQQKRLGFSGSWNSDDPSKLSNKYFKVLLENEWEKVVSAAGEEEYKAKGKEGVYMMPSDLALTWDPAFAAVAEVYAGDDRVFLEAFAAAWTKMMNADRFKGPVGSVCDDSGESAATATDTVAAS